ncbi:MAG: hypothetical protein ACK559_14640, partial [bacterium]
RIHFGEARHAGPVGTQVDDLERRASPGKLDDEARVGLRRSLVGQQLDVEHAAALDIAEHEFATAAQRRGLLASLLDARAQRLRPLGIRRHLVAQRSPLPRGGVLAGVRGVECALPAR